MARSAHSQKYEDDQGPRERVFFVDTLSCPILYWYGAVMEMTPSERVIAQKLLRVQQSKQGGVPWCAQRAITHTAAELDLARERVAQVWTQYCDKGARGEQSSGRSVHQAH